MTFESFPLGRVLPPDWDHVEKYPIRRLLAGEPFSANVTLPLPYQYRVHYDQGQEGACVAFGISWMMSILNRRRYNPWPMYDMASQNDELSETPPGTTARAGFEVALHHGLWVVHRGVPSPLSDPAHGIKEYRWAATVDEARECIAKRRTPIGLGVNWYTNFDAPEQDRQGRWWIGRGSLGRIRGGHFICGFKMSDRLGAVGLVNSWNLRYPIVWMPYDTLERLRREDGECGLVTDNP